MQLGVSGNNNDLYRNSSGAEFPTIYLILFLLQEQMHPQVIITFL